MKIIKKDKIIRFSYILIFFITFILIALSLITFDESDNNIFRYDSNVDEINNILGFFGANLSASLFKSFGDAKFYFPLVFFCWLIRVVIYKKIPSVLNVSLIPVALFCLCTFMSILKNHEFLTLSGLKIGFVGQGIYEFLENFYSYYLQIIFNNRVIFLSCFLLTFIVITISIGLPLNLYINLLRFTVFLVGYIIIIPINLFLKKKVNLKFNLSNFSFERKNKLTRVYKRKPHIQKKGLNIDYSYPQVSLLESPVDQKRYETENYKSISSNKAMLENVLSDFNIKGSILSFKQGPIVTLYELKPAPGTKTSTVIGLSDDIARSMSSLSSRISAIPGRDAIGIEIPNKQIQTVYLKELIDSKEYRNSDYTLPLVLGKDILGKPVIVDLARMPHLLVAGTTGSGKSVGINAMILSLLYNCSPESCRLILIDPKMLELSVYKDIPHLLTEVVTDTKKAIIALKWAVKEMEKRYQLMSELGVRNIEAYNDRVRKCLYYSWKGY